MIPFQREEEALLAAVGFAALEFSQQALLPLEELLRSGIETEVRS